MSSNYGPTAALTYFGPTGDELLEQITFTTHSGTTTLSQSGYSYNADNNVTSLAVSSPSAEMISYTYDKANRLLSGLFGTGPTPQYAYAYDAASNLTSITPNGTQERFSYSTTNAIATGTYNANGSPTTLGGISYIWDGANRVVGTANSANHATSNFTYDGLNRLVRVVDSINGSVTADHSYTWCGAIRCLAHDNTQSGSPVSTQYFAQGVIKSGTSYYYVQDRLRSVTQLVTSTGAVASQSTYDPYGNKIMVSGAVVSDIGYAGYFYHAASGLDFALFRAYDPAHARWVNRDPIGEAGGINLYAYVGGNPMSHTDSRGTGGPAAEMHGSENHEKLNDAGDSICDYWIAFCIKKTIVCLRASCTYTSPASASGGGCPSSTWVDDDVTFAPTPPNAEELAKESPNCTCTKWGCRR